MYIHCIYSIYAPAAKSGSRAKRGEEEEEVRRRRRGEERRRKRKESASKREFSRTMTRSRRASLAS
jgi:hypothetical protein